MAEPELGLVEAMSSLRNQLLEAIEAAQGHRLTFGLAAPIQVTLNVQVTKGANGEIGWWVLKAGATTAKSSTHTVTLALAPTLETPGGGRTTDVKITGASEAGDQFGPTHH